MMKYQNATNKMPQFGTIKSLIWQSGQRSPTMVRDTSLEVVYLHAKYVKPVLNDKKVTTRTRFATDWSL
jgi:hypothetical protein